MKKEITTRYRVELSRGGFWPCIVVCGDGTRELFKGSRKACERVACELTTAYLDGQFTSHPKVDTLRDTIRAAWLTGVDDFRRLYDGALLAYLGIETFQDLYAPLGSTAGHHAQVAAVIGFYKDEREPRLLSWNRLTDGEHWLYAAPQPMERKPLTDEQLREVLRQCPHDAVEALRVRWLYAKDFARAIEQAHGVKAAA